MRHLAIVVVLCSPAAAAAQPAVTLAIDVLFYGDNTEFSNPFRDGDTLLGNWGRVAAAVAVNDRVTIEAGLCGNWRYGDFARVGQLRPVLSLTLTGAHARFVFGTLGTVERTEGPGPDLAGPHGLLPAIQVETLSFTRPHEAGLQWKIAAPRLAHDVWINWQRLNSPRARERFDTGAAGRVALGGPIWLRYDWHLVHQGGQRFSAGPVTDSYAGAIGAAIKGRVGGVDEMTAEVAAVASRDVPNRADREHALTGRGVFARLAVRDGPWRGHAILWRSRDFVKDEGDPNYQALRQDGTIVGSIRDYAEAGLTRAFKPAPGIDVEASARLHRVEQRLAYSYRVLAHAALAWPLWP
jgi:hypothetical protein